MIEDKKRFAVVIRFESENPANQRAPLVYCHNAPCAAARRLTALINRRADWVPACVAVGTRFYITDRNTGEQYALNPFKAKFCA